MIFGSVCSGIEAASVAWEPLGWRAAFFSEIENFTSAVLAHHYPDVPNRGDLTKFQEWPDATVDVFAGGTPCQSYSVAGLRKGLDDPRGDLMLTFGAAARRNNARWIVWENVPGVLSSSGGRDFGTFLGMLAELGYGFAYRVLDAQNFGVPQRRRRVFGVGYFGDWRPAAAVLFERESLRGNPAPGRGARKDVAGTLIAGIDRRRGSRAGADEAAAGLLIPRIAGCLQERDAKGADSDTKPGHLIPVAFDSRQDCVSSFERFGSLSASSPQAQAVAFQTRGSNIDVGAIAGTFGTNADRASGSAPMVMQGWGVRRLTPIECERLQGFPDGYTDIPRRGFRGAKLCPDGPRYKALGNSMAVPVMRWIGERIDMVDAIVSQERAA